MTTRPKLYVVETIHEGTNLCVRRATREDEGWAMLYNDAIELARESARAYKCKWFDFSDAGADFLEALS